MAITNAQQARQLYKKGSKKPVEQAGVMNYMPSEMVTVPKIAKSSPDTPTAKLAYITPEEQDVLIDLNLYGSLDGKPNRGPGGIPSLEGDFGPGGNNPGGFSSNQGGQGGTGNTGDKGGIGSGEENYSRGDSNYQSTINEIRRKAQEEEAKRQARQTEAAKKQAEDRAKAFAAAKARDTRKARDAAAKQRLKDMSVYSQNLRVGQKNLMDLPDSFYDQEEEKDDFLSGAYDDLFENQYNSSGIKGPLLSVLDPLFKKGAKSTRNYFTDNVLGKGAFKDITPEDFANMTLTQRNEIYDGYMGGRQSGETDAYGNLTAPMGGGGDNNQTYVPPIIPDDDTGEDATPSRNLGGLAPRFAGSIFDFTGLADGGRAGMMDGGMMEDTPEGGIMDLESGRQMYFLGKLVKKATRAVKKVAKSPLGKAALMYGLGSLGASALGKYQAGTGTGFFSKIKPFMSSLKTDFFTKKNPLLFSDGKFSVGKATSLGIGIPFALDALGVGKEEEDNSAYEKYMKDMRLDIPALRGRRNLAAAFDGSTYNYEAYADGGRTGYQEGGDAEPVAKETMPLLDMDNQEMDLREDGGFVPIGRMERADDVPARLSKNEFVFTADAVRNAGEGDIDKGAEVMYNMMKNLESGGEVSEESQGLDGAREMFQTSQRLEEVL